MRISSETPTTKSRRYRTLSLGIMAVVILMAAGCDDGDPEVDEIDDNDEAVNGVEDEPDDVAVGEVEVTLRVAATVPEAGTHGQPLVQWAEHVEEATGGRVEVEIHDLDTLLEGPDILAGVGDGRAESGLTYNLYHAADMPLWNVGSYPLLTHNGHATAEAMKTMYEEFDPLRREFEDRGVIPLWFNITGSAVLGSDEPIEALAQVDGMRLRATGLNAQMIEAAGGDPVFMPFPETYESLQRGVIDGWAAVEMGTSMAVGLEEIAPYFTLALGQYASGAVLVNADEWNGLDGELRSIIEELSADYPGATTDLITEMESDFCDEIIDAGGEVIELSEADIDEWRDIALDGIVAELRETASAQGVDEDEFEEFVARYTELVEEYEAETDFVDGLEACAART